MSVPRVLTVMAIMAALSLAGCGTAAESGGQQGAEPPAAGAGAASAPAAGLEPIPTDGPGESTAVAALPATEAQAKQVQEASGTSWPGNLDAGEPVMTAYILVAEVDGQAGLFEVRADGVAHNVYAYQRAFDAASILWSPAEGMTSAAAAPRSERETAAVAAVEAALRDAFPDSAIAASVFGYRFSYLLDGESILTIEVSPGGSVISVGDQ